MQVSWSSFNYFKDETVNSGASTEAGVYLLWVKLNNGNWRCFYVGQADNLQRRLLEHLSDSEKNKCVKTHVDKYTLGYEYAKVSKQGDRDGVEKFLFDHYKPECNENDPPGKTPITVNLP